MYCVLFGICKRFFGLWFDLGEIADYKINFRIFMVDVRFVIIRLLNNILRVFRLIENYCKYFKVFELRFFLLFYGFVVFYDVFFKLYYEYFFFLSEVVFILL